MDQSLSWAGIVRLGLVQTALGAVIVLTTSTLNRIMVVEMALPAMIPGFLVAVHHMVQLARPRIGYGSDLGGRRTPWIIGGIAVLASGGFLAALGTVLIAEHFWLGGAIALTGFFAIGLGSGAAGTSLLALLAKRVDTQRKPAAATIVWFMMIAGFAITAGTAGQFLDPFSPARLLAVTGTVSLLAIVVTVLAIHKLEPVTRSSASHVAREETRQHAHTESISAASRPSFSHAIREVWGEASARRFTLFVFISMLAYSLQDLILEPFAGLAFGMTPGESTALAGTQHGGVLLGMLAVAVSGSLIKGGSARLLRRWIIGGCLASAFALAGLAWGGTHPEQWNLSLNVVVLGFANGAFAVAAIASMMVLASRGEGNREGLRMGLWGAAQAIAFAIGGFLGTVAADLARVWLSDPAIAYGSVFLIEALLFVIAAQLGAAVKLTDRQQDDSRASPTFGQVAMQEVLEASNP
ncbi:MAG: BCD family MFS transporter [Halieaceae bacterium]|jgi:BCD family chlorophyll transporter-like MFS transporter|nr:BCD family MFS transporter [Halieaceae bacterium]